jgi:hypothetical protein
MALRAGMCEKFPTLGADLRQLAILFSYARYTGGISAYAGGDENKWQLVISSLVRIKSVLILV